MRALAVIALLTLAPVPVDAATLYVNNSGSPACSDATTKASNAVGSPWCTIYRAMKGAAPGSADVSAQAASQGDIVLVTGGTYSLAITVADSKTPAYNPVNEGASGDPIEVRCIGDCRLQCPTCNSPALGAYQRDYIWWTADIGLGYSWVVDADGACANANPDVDGFCTDGTSSDATLWNTKPDTGLVTLWETTGSRITGAVLTSVVDANYQDNYNAIRIENSFDLLVQNNDMFGWHNGTDSVNGTCVTTYVSEDVIIEHNRCRDVGTPWMIKDNPIDVGFRNDNIRIRFNWAEDATHGCAEISANGSYTNGPTYVYRNVCKDTDFATYVTGGGMASDWWTNNTFINPTNGIFFGNTSGSGGRIWNSIVQCGSYCVYVASGMPTATAASLQHNNYTTAGTAFYRNESVGNKSFATYLSDFPTQDQTATVSAVQDPRFANAAGDDYRLCTASGVPHASCPGASPALTMGLDILDLDGDADTADAIPAGAYIGDSVTIGLDVAASVAGPNSRGKGLMRILVREPAVPSAQRFMGAVAVTA